MMKALRKTIVMSGFLAGSVVGGLTIAGAFAGGSGEADVGRNADLVSIEASLVMPSLRGNEASLFEAKLSSLASSSKGVDFGSSSMALLPGSSDGDLCYRIEANEAVAEGCFFDEVIATGLSYVEFMNHGKVDIFGVVPDGVGTVLIDGAVVPLEGNIWHLSRISDDRVLSLEVVSRDGRVSAELKR
jgi:hypothetical protein